MSDVLDPGKGTQADNSLVGRVIERATIHGLLAAAWRAEGGALVLAGPPGIGKSTLVQYAIDSAPGFQILRIAGVESEMALGYAGVHQLVLPILDGLRRLPEPQREAMDAVLGRTTHGPIDPFLVGLAVLSLVADAAAAQPVLVVIDDAQWLDDESAVALSFVGRRLRAERVAMVVALRDTPDTSGRFEHLRRLDLAGLGDSEALELLAGSARAPVDPTVASRIVAATRGNPLALVELPAALTVEQLRGAAPLPDPLPIGDRLSGLFASRVRVLDADARMVLLLAAAERLGDPVLLRRAAETAGELPWDEAVARAEASGLVTFASTVEFRHPLVRSAVYYSAGGRPIGVARIPPSPARSTPTPTPTVVPGTSALPQPAPTSGSPKRWKRQPSEPGGEAARLPPRRICGAPSSSPPIGNEHPSDSSRRLAPSSSPVTVRRLAELLERARAEGLGSDHDADAAWTEALVHIIAGDLREPTALLARALPRIGPGDTELAVGSCVAAHAVLLAGGHLVDEPTRRTIAAEALAVTDRCEVREPLAQLVKGVAARVADGRAVATPVLRAAVTSRRS